VQQAIVNNGNIDGEGVRQSFVRGGYLGMFFGVLQSIGPALYGAMPAGVPIPAGCPAPAGGPAAAIAVAPPTVAQQAILQGVGVAPSTAPPAGSDAPPEPYHGKPGEVIDPSKVNVYRGGSDLNDKPGETKVLNGQAQPTHGMSLETDPAGLVRFGGTKEVVSIPDEIQIIQRGKRDTHFEVVPKQPMTPERFQGIVKQIKLE
jgi:hypothetical protein